MFRTTKKEKQLDMFTSISGMLKGTAYEQFHNGQAWHNMFREQVVNRIDDNLFKSLLHMKIMYKIWYRLITKLAYIRLP